MILWQAYISFIGRKLKVIRRLGSELADPHHWLTLSQWKGYGFRDSKIQDSSVRQRYLRRKIQPNSLEQESWATADETVDILTLHIL